MTPDEIYAAAAIRWPEITRESFLFNDPGLVFDHLVDNVCRIFPKPGDLVMDIGANRGIVTLMCALRGAYVVAYEPQPTAFRILKDTINRNGLEERVQAVNAAISTSTGSVRFQYSHMIEKEAMVVNGRTALLTLNPLSDILCYVDAVSFEDAIGDKEWDIVKIDIEGFEFELLLKCPECVFGQIKYLTLELHFDECSRETYDQLIARLNKFFVLDGVMDGENRYQALFARRR